MRYPTAPDFAPDLPDTEFASMSAETRWIVRPGNDVFLVYSHNWQNYCARCPTAGR